METRPIGNALKQLLPLAGYTSPHQLACRAGISHAAAKAAMAGRLPAGERWAAAMKKAGGQVGLGLTGVVLFPPSQANKPIPAAITQSPNMHNMLYAVQRLARGEPLAWTMSTIRISSRGGNLEPLHRILTALNILVYVLLPTGTVITLAPFPLYAASSREQRPKEPEVQDRPKKAKRPELKRNHNRQRIVDVESLLMAYRAGERPIDLAQRFKVSRQRIHQVLRAHGEPSVRARDLAAAIGVGRLGRSTVRTRTRRSP